MKNTVYLPKNDFQMAIPIGIKERQLREQGLRIFDPNNDYNITTSEQNEIREFLGHLYNGGIKVSIEIFLAFVQDAFDLEEIRGQISWMKYGADY